MDLIAKINEQRLLRASRRRAELHIAFQNASSIDRTSSDTVTSLEPFTLDDLRAITKRRGFLEAQNGMASLSTLKKWHCQLQLLELEDSAIVHEPQQTSEDIPSDMTHSLAEIGRDRICFDVSYATATCTPDIKGWMLDRADQAAQLTEVLAFSLTRSKCTLRCVLFSTLRDAKIHVRTSVYEPDIDAIVEASAAAGVEARDLLGALRV